MRIFSIKESDLAAGDDALVTLLNKASAAELSPLVDALTQSGSARFKMRPAVRRQLLAARQRQQFGREDVVLMVYELEHFGGNTLANAYRRKGLAYREIVLAVLKHLNVADVDPRADIATLEQLVLAQVVEQSLEQMDAPERKALLERLGLKDADGHIGLGRLKESLRLGRINPRRLPEVVTSQLIPQFRKHVLPLARAGAPRLLHATRYLRSPYVAVPAALVGAGALAYRLTLENYAVLIPCVAQIARIRQNATPALAGPAGDASQGGSGRGK